MSLSYLVCAVGLLALVAALAGPALLDAIQYRIAPWWRTRRTRRTRRDPWDTAAAQLVRDAADGPAVDTDAIAAFHDRIRAAMDLEACREIWARGVADDHAREEDPR